MYHSTFFVVFSQIAEICYNFIEKNTYIKSHKELCANIFNVFGLLLTDYRYSTRFVYRIAEVVKSYEHATTVVAEGIKLLIESYNVKSLLREFVRQITDWQVDDQYQNGQVCICRYSIQFRNLLSQEIL